VAIATEPEWRALHRAADANVPVIERIVLKALLAAQAGSDLNAIADSVEAGGGVVLGKVFAGADEADRIMAEELPAVLLATLEAGAFASARFYRRQGGFLPDDPIDQESVIGDGPVDVLAPVASAEGGVSSVFIPPSGDLPGFALSPDFLVTNPESVAWANDFGSRQIVQISNETRRAIRELISQAFVDGVPPAKAARAIRDQIGLTRFQERAVRNLAREMKGRQRGVVRRFGKQFGAKVPQGGYNTVQIQAATKRYGKRLLRSRALTIARTETLAAANEGQRQLWLQARKAGALPAHLVKEWIITPDDDLCPVCRGMIGQQRELDKPFNTGRFGPVMSPPAHPRCRCAQGLARPKKAKKDRTTRPAETPLEARRRALSSGQLKGGPSDRLEGSINDVRILRVLDDQGDEVAGYWKPNNPGQVGPGESVDPDIVFFHQQTTGGAASWGEREVLASDIDQLWGTNLVPTTVHRTVDDIVGSIQEGVKNAKTYATVRGTPIVNEVTAEQWLDLTVYDMVIGNVDRHGGNLMLQRAADGTVRLVAIDNGLSFVPNFAFEKLRDPTVQEEAFKWIQGRWMSKDQTAKWVARLEDPKFFELIGKSNLSAQQKADAIQRAADIRFELINEDGNFWGLMSEFLDVR
jgi:hypothetical protein